MRCKDVHNHLELALPPGDHRDDLTLTAMANDARTLGHTVAEGVEATAKNGDIALTGAVRSGTEREAAEVMIADLPVSAKSGTTSRSVTTRIIARVMEKA